MPPPVKTSEKEKLFYEKGFDRKPLARWDEAWSRLSPRARLLYLDEIRGPVRSEKEILGQPGTPIINLPPEPLEELVKAKFVILNDLAKGKGVQAFANPEIYDFAARTRCFRAVRVLQADAAPDAFERYVKWICYESRLQSWVMKLLFDKGLVGIHTSMLHDLVGSYRWPNWVVENLDLPRGRQLLDHLIAAKGPVPITQFLKGVTGAEGTKRSTLDALIGHLAIFEDFDPETHDIVVDLLPSVRAEMGRVATDKILTKLEVVKEPVELGPVEGLYLTDLRTFLLELASEPMRLKQDGSPFAKELERFVSGFDALPSWLNTLLEFGEGIEERVNLAFDLAEDLKFVSTHTQGKVTQLHLTTEGQKWLGVDPIAQHLAVYKFYRTNPVEKTSGTPLRFSSFAVYDYDDDEDPSGDGFFLGADTTVFVSEKPKSVNSTREVKLKDRLALRHSLDRAFSSIPIGVFHTLKSIADRLSHFEMNPLFVGANPEKVVIFNGYHKMPMLDEERREFARSFLKIMMMFRLVTLGCFRVARGPNDEVCVSRTPWYDAYFGREVSVKDLAHVHEIGGSTRVVVQPDFSIVVIGLNPLPLAELAPFCDRTTKGSGQGAVILKLTRDSILRAMSHGMTSEEILTRLDKHAGSTMPANVRREAEEWSRWARKVQVETLIVLRCPDRSTADRVVSAFKSKVERISDTLVGVTSDQVNSASRTKLQAQGLFVNGHLPEKPKAQKKLKPVPKRYW